MGIGGTPPIGNGSEWTAFKDIVQDSGVVAAVKDMVDGSNFLFTFSLTKLGTNHYKVDFTSCSNGKTCTGTLSGGGVTHTTGTGGDCTGSIDRVSTALEFNYLGLVFDTAEDSSEDAHELIDELKHNNVIDVNLSVSGSVYTAVFTFESKSNPGTTFTKNADSTYSGGSFGSITIA